MRCVVCDGLIPKGQELYANAWERSRKQYPCCSSSCCDAFDPDIHWIPVVKPELPDQGETNQLLGVARRRLKDGDRPTVVIRDMLLAGITTRALRKILHEGIASSQSTRKTVRQLNVAGGIVAVLTGHWSWFKNTAKCDPDAMEDALNDLERWEQTFGGPADDAL